MCVQVLCLRSPKWKIAAICKKITSRPPTSCWFLFLPAVSNLKHLPTQYSYVWLVDCSLEAPVNVVSFPSSVLCLKGKEEESLLFMTACHFCPCSCGCVLATNLWHIFSRGSDQRRDQCKPNFTGVSVVKANF